MKMMYIIRGVPGSGKSTLAKKLIKDDTYICEVDKYFINFLGEYKFIRELLSEAHAFCFSCVKKALESEAEEIAVANTFCKKWEYEKYINLAKLYGYDYTIIECKGNFKNVHDVPDETVRRMRSIFEPA